MTTDFSESHFRRFTITAFFCFIVLFSFVWAWVLKAPMFYLDQEYPTWVAKLKLAQQNPAGKLLILGDSRPVADMIPARIGPNAVNLAFAGSTPIENFYFAQNITAEPSQPAAVLISFSPIEFVKAEFFWNRSVEFGFLNLKELDEIRSRSRTLKDDLLFGVKSPGDLDARLKSSLYVIKFPSYYFPALYAARFYQRHGANQKRLELTLSSRGQSYFGMAHGSMEPDGETVLKSFTPSKILDDYFDRLLFLFYSKKIPVYFISLPHNAASNKFYFAGLEEAFTEYLGHYVNRYPNFHILGEPFPSYPPEYFGDRSHLNEMGATRWSDHVVQLLNEAHVPGGPFGANSSATPEAHSL